LHCQIVSRLIPNYCCKHYDFIVGNSGKEILPDFRSEDNVHYNSQSMTLFDLLILLIVAGICGALGQAITGFSRGGCLVSIALGFVGAIVGLWIARALGLPELFPVRIGTTNFPIVWSIIGSALFVAVIAFLTRRR
jgi:uncharacterized membrane protein YeaQ/YmgE (transglycosylase-associated protein family)